MLTFAGSAAGTSEVEDHTPRRPMLYITHFLFRCEVL